jgi:hypothetical protein
MNIVTHSPEWGRYFIQQQNIRKKIAKTLDITAEIRDSEQSSTIPPDEIDVTSL